MPEKQTIFKSTDFENWFTLNDTVMGGKSQATCNSSSNGLSLEGVVVEEKGGFVSCKSPIFKPALDLSNFEGFKLNIAGRGRTLKFGVSCKYGLFGIKEFFLDKSPGGLRWVAEIKTKRFGITTIQVPFNDLEPTIIAKKVSFPIIFKSNSICQFQLLHSKFGSPGKLNPRFKPGKINFLLQSISVY